MLNANVPLPERLVRLLLGLAIGAFAVFGLAQTNIILVMIGFCVAATGLVGFCPACALVGRRLRQ